MTTYALLEIHTAVTICDGFMFARLVEIDSDFESQRTDDMCVHHPPNRPVHWLSVFTSSQNQWCMSSVCLPALTFNPLQRETDRCIAAHCRPQALLYEYEVHFQFMHTRPFRYRLRWTITNTSGYLQYCTRSSAPFHFWSLLVFRGDGKAVAAAN